MLFVIGLLDIVYVLAHLLAGWRIKLFVGCSVSSFLMRIFFFFFGKIIMLHKRYFWVKHMLENNLWNYVFLKSVVL